MEQKTFNLTDPQQALEFLCQLAENSPAQGTIGQVHLQMIGIKNAFELLKKKIKQPQQTVDSLDATAQIYLGENLIETFYGESGLCDAIEYSATLPPPINGDFDIYHLTGSGPDYPCWVGPRPKTKP